MTSTLTEIRTQFFEYLFGVENGYVCLCTQVPRDKTTFRQDFFAWPGDKDKVSKFIENNMKRHNIWFCVNLLSKRERTKAYCMDHNLVWADLDTCDPATIEPVPQCIIQSSPGRWQAIWRLDQKIDPQTAEWYSKKIAYKYSENGADPTGWDLTQLLRVPFTQNFKYVESPAVELHQALTTPLPVVVFEELTSPAPKSLEYDDDTPAPESLPPVDKVIYKYWNHLNRTAFTPLYETEPPTGDDWSKILWRLINVCLEVGMSTEETFAVALSSKCNKYQRDSRPIKFLWRDVLKADLGQKRVHLISGTWTPLTMPEIVTSDETKDLPRTFIDEYSEWATVATDAIPEYHDLSAFILLSAVIAGNLVLHTQYGKMIPNLWGLVLGDSTLTRKTTAMRMATEFITELDRDIVLATDGSAEGLLTGLSMRPNRTSMYFKDEVTGFFDAMAKKEYLAGMPETLTHLYDVPEFYTRRLRKETISLISPVFIFFGGGIRDKMYSLITDEHILSGFLPRFLVVSGDTDLSRVRRTGPATPFGGEARKQLRERLADLYESYVKTSEMQIGPQTITIPAMTEAILDPRAWERYQDIEAKMVAAADESSIMHYAMPTFERLSRSLLKMSMLIAAARQDPIEGLIQVSEPDVLNAAKYVQSWGRYTVDLITNSGKTTTQRTIDGILRMIEREPGLTRSKIMQQRHLTKREMDMIQDTLEDRQQILVKREGKGVRLWKV